MGEILEVEDLLSHLTAEGQLQSSGTFTLDMSRAKEKLAAFQFQDPFYYILKLVQAAVAGGAKGFSLNSGTLDVAVSIAGLGFTPFKMENLFYSLLDEKESDSALRHFAMGINAAIGTRASQIEVYTFDGKDGLEICWTKQGQRNTAWKPKGDIPQTRFLLKRTANDMFSDFASKIGSRDVMSMISGGRKGMDQEQGLIYDHAAFSPVAITLNSRACPGYDLGERPQVGFFSQLMARFFSGHPLNPKYNLYEVYLPKEGGAGLAAPRQSFSRCKSGFVKNESFSAIMVVPASLSAQLIIVPVRDGVSLKTISLSWEGPGAIFYVDAAALDVDLTEVQLIRNERNLNAFQELGRALCAVGEKYLEARVDKLPSHKRYALESNVKAGKTSPMVFT